MHLASGDIRTLNYPAGSILQVSQLDDCFTHIGTELHEATCRTLKPGNFENCLSIICCWSVPNCHNQKRTAVDPADGRPMLCIYARRVEADPHAEKLRSQRAVAEFDNSCRLFLTIHVAKFENPCRRIWQFKSQYLTIHMSLQCSS